MILIFLKRLIVQVHVHGSGEIKGLQVTVTWALNCL